MPSAFDIIGMVLGIMGLIGIFQIIGTMIYNNLPSQRFEALMNMLAEVDLAIKTVPLPPQFIEQSKGRLLSLEDSALDHQAKVYTAISYVQQFRAMLSGLSRQLNSLHGEALDLRTEILSKSEKYRELLAVRARMQTASSSVNTDQVMSHFDDMSSDYDLDLDLQDNLASPSIAVPSSVARPFAPHLDPPAVIPRPTGALRPLHRHSHQRRASHSWVSQSPRQQSFQSNATAQSSASTSQVSDRRVLTPADTQRMVPMLRTLASNVSRLTNAVEDRQESDRIALLDDDELTDTTAALIDLDVPSQPAPSSAHTASRDVNENSGPSASSSSASVAVPAGAICAPASHVESAIATLPSVPTHVPGFTETSATSETVSPQTTPSSGNPARSLVPLA